MAGRAPGNTVRLDELCSLIVEQVDPRREPEVLYIGLEHLQSGRIRRRGGGRSTTMQSSKSRFGKGDVLYGKLRPYLDKAIVTDDDGVCTTELLVLRPNEGVDSAFLVGALHSGAFIEHAMSGVTGVQHPRTSWQRIREFQMPALQGAEQSAFGSLVQNMEDAITTCEASLDALLDVKRAAMRELFTRGLRGEPQKETEIGLIPESWHTARLDNIARVVSTSMSYSELERAAGPVGGAGVQRVLGIKVSDMNRTGNEVRIVEAALDKPVLSDLAFKRCAPPGTIVFPKRGAAIATNKKRLSTTWTVFDPNVIGVLPGKEVDVFFLFQWFQRFDLATITEPGPTPQLNKKNLDPLILPLPDIDEQRAISEVLNAIDGTLDLHRRKKAVLEELFKALLNWLMSGEICVSDMDQDTLRALEPPIDSDALQTV